MTTFEELVASIPALPFRGYYVNKDGQPASIDDLTLISHIKDNLYVGGCIPGVDLGDFFSHVFSLYVWEKYKVGPNTKVVGLKMYDRAGKVDAQGVDEMSEQVVKALAEGGNVLVHCQAGINRSNLITAAALVKMGYTAREAIDLLREKRHANVLANKSFEEFLLNR